MTGNRPDFSGDWVLNRGACALSPGASAVQSASIRIEHRDPVICCAARFVFDAANTFEFTTERTASRYEGDDGDSAANGSAHWDGEGLVFTDVMGEAPAIVTMTWRYELLERGRRLRAVEQMRGDGRDQDNVWEFERRE